MDWEAGVERRVKKSTHVEFGVSELNRVGARPGSSVKLMWGRRLHKRSEL